MLYLRILGRLALVVSCLAFQPLTAMTKVIAHRGASREAPENSVQAYKKALEIGMDCMETDVHLSSEGVPVCRHDPRFDDHSSWKGPSLLSDMTLDQIKERSRYDSEVPTLEEILALKRGDVSLFVELKNDCSHAKQLVEAVCELTSSYCHTGKGTLYMGSFSPEIVSYLKEYHEADAIVGLVEFDKDFDAQMALKPNILGIDDAIATDARIADLLSQGFDVWVWTVDDLERGKHLAEQGVGAIITNDPRAMMQALEL